MRGLPALLPAAGLPYNDKCLHLHHTETLVHSHHSHKMKNIRITALRRTQYDDLIAEYENPIEHTCDVCIGQQWISIGGKCPEGFCPSAWETLRPFVESLAQGRGNFFDGWMRNPMSAMLSCNDGFRPVSFYIEVV